ncbi:MAG: glycoside hydrolase family 65 protein [Oscillospiraceae bacterium]|nr:glycoside hydrolase family 65 protein [Oscillospiraceae bacterium]
MDIWSYTQNGYNADDTVTNGNRFLIGNGYMGYRGTMDEWGRGEMAAVNLAGVYDQNGDQWREPVNAPNGLFAKLSVNGEELSLGKAEPSAHSQTVHFRRGTHSRDTEFAAARIQSERIVSAAEPHLLASRLTLTFKTDGRAELTTGIVTDIWDINGPHLFGHSYQTGAVLLAEARTGELDIPVAVAQAAQCGAAHDEKQEVTDTGVYRRICFDAKAGETVAVTLFSAVFTGMDGPEPGKRAAALCEQALSDGYECLVAAHEAAWEKLWQNSAVELSGCDEAARALNASLYHLHSIAPRHAGNLSIPARGLSGQTYKGAIFWDSEVFLFPVFVHTEPELAKALLRYRIETLPGALRKAAEYGFRGAFYPWESQEGGAEGCTNYNVTDVFTHRPVRTYFRDRQIHISGDIAYAFWRYYEITGDLSLMREGGAEVILQCARFYLSRAHRRVDGDDVELLDVIGPDEYHERVNNNAFTNQMAAHCMSRALALTEIFAESDPAFIDALLQKLDYKDDLARLKTVYPLLRPVFAEGEVIEQFDGYFALEDCSLETVRGRLLDEREYWGTNHGVAAHTQIIKQADVVAMTALFPALFSDETVERNWRYYEPRTEHGSSLSACMHALTACCFGRPDLAWEHFIKSASIDLAGGGKHWAGEIYIGGTHPAANGGAWMIAVLGFAGLSVRDGEITASPRLPPQITSLRFPVTVRGKRYRITVTHDGWSREEG